METRSFGLGYTQRRHVSTDGFELMFVTNHLGPFQLTHLLLDPLMTSGSARILNMTAPSTVELHFNSLKFFGAPSGMKEIIRNISANCCGEKCRTT